MFVCRTMSSASAAEAARVSASHSTVKSWRMAVMSEVRGIPARARETPTSVATGTGAANPPARSPSIREMNESVPVRRSSETGIGAGS